jgi:hypothetical protein
VTLPERDIDVVGEIGYETGLDVLVAATQRSVASVLLHSLLVVVALVVGSVGQLEEQPHVACYEGVREMQSQSHQQYAPVLLLRRDWQTVRYPHQWPSD